MTATTIKVSPDVRDRLKAQASNAHRTLGEHLSHLADLGDKEMRFARLRQEIQDTPAEAMESYAAEVADWETVDRG